MNVFYMSKIKKISLISNIIIMALTMVFAFIYYNQTPDTIKTIFNQLFNKETHSNYYILSGLLFIFANTYLSSSYAGVIGSTFTVFIKSIQISYSLIYINNNSKFTLFLFILLCIKIILEVIFVLTITINCEELSCYIYYTLFQKNKKLCIKSILNNQLNIVIYSLILLFICIFIRNL